MTTAVRERDRLDAAIRAVLDRDACSGCGGCTLIDSGIEMRENEAGYLRPVRGDGGEPASDSAAVFDRVCPGVVVSANEAPETRPHATMGSYRAVWMSWAADPDIRRQGSSGGVITALSTWLLESGQAARVVGAAAAADPRRSVPVTITTREQAFAAAGSRYTPVATLTEHDVLEPGTAMVGKPCEVSALRRLNADGNPLIMSFFCAGTPSARATDTLLRNLGVEDEANVDELWYRGRGWPGRFTARSRGTEVNADYDSSWGSTLGPTTQWRCKICPDGVGESADIVAADYWTVDDRGYPVFIEGDGVSALIARTQTGLDTVLRAAAAGVIHLETIEMDSLDRVQPLQRERRRYLAARLLGSRLAGRSVPRYRGFSLLRLSLGEPKRALTVLCGAFSRVRRAKDVGR